MKNRTLVFTIALEGYESTYRSCIDTISQYAERNKYDFELINSAPRQLLPIEAAWLKLPLILEALRNGYEWVSFIDSDIDVRAFTPSFDSYLENLRGTKSIFISTGKSGRLNSGVLFVKNTKESLAFFENVLKHCDMRVPEEDRTAFENGHIIYFGKQSRDFYILDHDMWNNNSSLNPDSYIQHYSSGELREWYFKNRYKTRLSLFDRLFSKSQKKRNAKLKMKRPNLLSESIKELIPYYKRTFSSFH